MVVCRSTKSIPRILKPPGMTFSMVESSSPHIFSFFPASDTKSGASPPWEPGEPGLGMFRRKKRNVDLNLNFVEAGAHCQGTEGQGISFKTLRTPDIQQYLNVPWDIPKLKSKLKNKRNCFRGQSSSPETSPKKVVMKKSPDVEVNYHLVSRYFHFA